jgi:hypothetical protein
MSWTCRVVYLHLHFHCLSAQVTKCYIVATNSPISYWGSPGSNSYPYIVKGKTILVTCLERAWGLQEVEDPRFNDSRHMKVVRLSVLHTGGAQRARYTWPGCIRGWEQPRTHTPINQSINLHTGRFDPTGTIPGTYFYYTLSRPQDHSLVQGLCVKNSSDTMGNRNHDLPACSALAQPTALPRAPTLHPYMACANFFIVSRNSSMQILGYLIIYENYPLSLPVVVGCACRRTADWAVLTP